MKHSALRLPTVLGPGRLGIFKILCQWLAEPRGIYVIGDGHQLFQFGHAHDLLDSYLLARDAGCPGIYNVGPRASAHSFVRSKT